MENNAHYSKLTPISFLERSTSVYPNKLAVKYNDRSYTYKEFSDRINNLAGALKAQGVKKGDKVAFLVPNIPEMLEGHFAPLKIGAILVAINTRLSGREISYILNHSESKVLVFDSEFGDIIEKIKPELPNIDCFVQVVDTEPENKNIESIEYESFLNSSPEGKHFVELDSEEDIITINYTSGTTGLPKGVQYNSRGAYISSLGNVIELSMSSTTNYLWTLPMFHCNGWSGPWAVTAAGGTHVCLRQVRADEIFRLISEEVITNMCCAPTVLTAMYTSKDAKKQDLSKVIIMVGGAPPAPIVIRSIEEMGATIIHGYGLTETYALFTLCKYLPSWDSIETKEIEKMRARQGVPFIPAGNKLRVVDENMNDVIQDGKHMGEVIMRGNTVMSGYLNDKESTDTAFKGGWFHSGDLAVWFSDGYIELQDRAKDIIISGGENISTQEVEKVLMENDGVAEVSVIGVPDDKWGEVPKAFVTTREGITLTEEELIGFAKERIARFKAPKYVEFGDLPKTSTGKIQKYILRDREWAGKDKRIQGSKI
ncbi:MAG: long-chain-fatty-acid--CoA ligase [Dehalococcoidia bacterium]